MLTTNGAVAVSAPISAMPSPSRSRNVPDALFTGALRPPTANSQTALGAESGATSLAVRTRQKSTPRGISVDGAISVPTTRTDISEDVHERSAQISTAALQAPAGSSQRSRGRRDVTVAV